MYADSLADYYCDLFDGKFYMNGEVILEEDLSSSAIAKIKLMRACIGLKLLPEQYSPVVIEERPERLAGTGDVDSNNGVDYSNRVVTNPFTNAEFYYFQKLLHLHYHNVKLASFQSAQGKFLFTLLTEILALDQKWIFYTVPLNRCLHLIFTCMTK